MSEKQTTEELIKEVNDLIKAAESDNYLHHVTTMYRVVDRLAYLAQLEAENAALNLKIEKAHRIVWGQTYPNHKKGDECILDNFGRCYMCSTNIALRKALKQLEQTPIPAAEVKDEN